MVVYPRYIISYIISYTDLASVYRDLCLVNVYVVAQAEVVKLVVNHRKCVRFGCSAINWVCN